MRKLTKLGMAMLPVLAFVGCGINSPLVDESQSTKQPIEVPCQKETYDDANYYRVLGKGSFFSMDRARQFAIQDARTEMQKKIADINGKIADCFMYDDSIVDMRIMLSKALLDYDASMVCSSVVEEEGTYTAYVALEVSKETIRNGFVVEFARISKARNLGIDFTDNKYANCMNEIMEMKQ